MSSEALLAVTAAIFFLGLVSRRLESSVVSPFMLMMALGAITGPGGLGWVPFHLGSAGIVPLLELTLVIVLFSDAASMDTKALTAGAGLPMRLLTVGMPLTVVCGTLAAMALFRGLGLADAALLAAVLAPTDAALGQAVATSRRVPVTVRQALSTESGLNDGLALPLVFVLVCLANIGHSPHPVEYWVSFAFLQVFLGPAVGAGVGVLGARLFARSSQAGWTTRLFERLTLLAMSVMAFALAELVGGNGFIAAFVAGLAVSWTAPGWCACVREFAEAEGRLLGLLTFFVFGASLPQTLPRIDGRTIAYSVLSLTVVRALPVAISLAGTGLDRGATLFVAWFGPRGVASLLFGLLVVARFPTPTTEFILDVVTVTVFASTLAHGATAAGAVGWLERRALRGELAS